MALWRFRDVTIDIDNLGPGGDFNMAELLESPKRYHEAHGQNRTRGDHHQVHNYNEGGAVHEAPAAAGRTATSVSRFNTAYGVTIRSRQFGGAATLEKPRCYLTTLLTPFRLIVHSAIYSTKKAARARPLN